MRRAAVLAGEVVSSTLRLLKPGVRENEIAAEAEYQMRRRGASGPAFETIVAFGERSALPHARPTIRRLGKNELARVGVTCGEVDAAARKVLSGYKLEQKFAHSTGHGLGLEVHEDPRVAKGQSRILEPGNVITIEPGVYVEGVGGIRIEDDVALHNGRTEVLTRVPRDLIEL